MEEKKNKIGRPPLFKSAEELQKKIDEYFETECKDQLARDEETGCVLTDSKGKAITIFNPPTVSGLALFLGFENRNSLYDYEEKSEFTSTIKRAIARIENYAEKQLFIGNSTGAIFWLKNKGWKDKTEVENSGTLGIKKVFVTKDDQKKTDDIIDEMIK